MKKITKKKFESGAIHSMALIGTLTVGFGLGALGKLLLDKVRGVGGSARLMGEKLFTGEDPVIETAKRL